jgi:type I restriction enzyme, S subunit
VNLETFFEKFDELADAPDAVAKMRGLLIHLAIGGKLVSNNPQEEPVALSLSGPSPDDEDLPSNWRCGLVGDAFTFEYGDNLPAPRRTETGEYPVYGSNGIVGTHDTYLTKEPAIIVGRKGSAGALNISEGPSWTTDVAYFVRPPKDLDLRFTYYLFKTLRLDDLGKGIKPGLSRKDAYALPITFPPFAEQKRIAARVDELMALCDRLEAQQQAREARYVALARASLARFANASTPANLQFVFHPLYGIPPADLRKSLLNLAVQGKLVPQDPNDEPASVLINTARTAALGSGYRGRTNSEDDNNPKFAAHVPDDVPTGWSACPLEELFRFIDYRGRTPVRRSSGVRLITAKNVKKGFVANEPVEFIAADVYPKWMTRGLPRRGDLLFVTEGHTMGFVGTLNFDFEYALAQRTIDLQPFCDGYGPFFLYYLMSEPFQRAILSNTTGSAAQGIKASKLKRIRVVVPPLAEQRRIVAKVEHLMSLIDILETQLAASRVVAANVLSALVAELIGTTRYDMSAVP